MLKPKYIQLADKLRLEIKQMKYLEGELIPSESTLQEEYGLSRHTVRQGISILVNEGLLRTEKGSGTYVIEQALVPTEQGHKKTIGVIMTYLSDYIFPSIIRGIEKELSEQGYSLLLGTTNNNHEKEKECLQQMIEQGVDGLIIEPTKSNEYNPNLSYYVALKEQKIPYVMINAIYEELNTHHICVNDTKSGYLATKHLIENGHEKLLLVTKIDDLQGKYRMKGFIQAIEEASLQFSPEDIVTYTTETKEIMIEKVLQRLSRVDNQLTGIVSYNDEVAIQLIQGLESNDIFVPENVSIVGNDDSNLRIFGNIQLTTLAHPKEAMGEMAAQQILKGIGNEKMENYYFEPIIIQGQSVSNIIEK